MINSTFYDMIAEYDCFINEVFPRLREYCSDKDIEIGFRDVAFSAKELPADDNILLQDFRCIDADRTFFICFRAQKLGWRPDYTNINRITVQEYPEITSFIGNISITELAIMHALVPFKRCVNGETIDLPPVKHSLFYFRKPDYLDRLRKSFAAKQPIISELLPYVDYAPKEKITISFTSGNQYCIGAPKNFAPCVLDPAFAALGLDELFASIKHSSRIQYDLQGIVRLLIYGRLLEPASKMATMRQNDSYYRPLVKSSNDDNVYDTLDVIYENRKQIIQRMNSCISKGIGRNTSTVFYDVTNFFFETEQPDEDEVDEEGIVIEKGLRKMGVSKENRKQPIVQMGLFLDDNGIPISIEIFPGNTLDHLTFRTAMRNTVDILDMERFILIADRGMYNGTNMCHVLDQGNGYIVSKSLKKSTKKEREWVLDQEGYTVVSPDFRYKSRIVTRHLLEPFLLRQGKAREPVIS